MPRKNYKFPWGEVRKKQVAKDKSPLAIIYYGGKARDARWVIDNYPPNWNVHVDLFGGGGSVTFELCNQLIKRQEVSGEYVKTDDTLGNKVLVYNDVGNVTNFLRCLRDFGDELYTALYLSPFSREEYMLCRDTWASSMLRALESGEKDDWVEWARRWYINTQVGFSHEELGTGFVVSKTINRARGFANRVDDLPYFTDNLRYVSIEKGDYARVIDLYDSERTLFYADPPYESSTRVRQDAYLNEMDAEQQRAMLHRLKSVQGQVVISGYHSDLYDTELEGWRIVEKTTASGIANVKQQEDRSSRTEVLWIKEKQHGLWTILEES
jgi:DNA adenine methylase